MPSKSLWKRWEEVLENTEENEEECILWNGSLRGDGYAEICVNSKTGFGHRFSYMLHKNNEEPIPHTDDNGNLIVVRHTCDNKRCINPDHLVLGTQSQNCYEDKIESGTLQTGEKCHSSIISEELAQKIKCSHREPGEEGHMTVSNRARFFNVPRKVVCNIDHGKTWAWLPDRHGNVIDNESIRETTRERQRQAQKRIWDESMFEEALEKLKKYTKEVGNPDDDLEGNCWVWQKSKDKDGYGKTTIFGKEIKVHILACEIEYKRHKREGELARHLCGQKSCANPSHMKFGSLQDVIYKRNKKRKFSDDDIRYIRSSSESGKELCRKYNTVSSHISEIRSRKIYKDVE